MFGIATLVMFGRAVLGFFIKHSPDYAVLQLKGLWIPVQERNLTLWECFFVNILLVSCFLSVCAVRWLSWLSWRGLMPCFVSFSLIPSSVVTFFLPPPVCRMLPLLILHHFSPPSNNPISALWAGWISSSQTPSNTNHVTKYWAD